MEEPQDLRSLILNGFVQTAQADLLCDKGLDEQGDAMADAAFYNLIRRWDSSSSDDRLIIYFAHLAAQEGLQLNMKSDKRSFEMMKIWIMRIYLSRTNWP